MKILKASELTVPHVTVLIYGTPGMGKTTLLGKLKGSTLIVDADKGASVLAGTSHVDILRVSEDFHEVPELIKEFKDNCPYDNIALDSLSEIERSILTRLASRNGNGIPSLQDYGRVNNSLLNLCRQLRELSANIFFTAWEKYTEVFSQTGEKYSRIEPMIRDRNMENVCGLCDIVGRIYVDKDSQERRVWLDGRPSIIAKDRVYKRKNCGFTEILPARAESTRAEEGDQ